MHPISYMFDVCMYVWMHRNDACLVDRKKRDVRGEEEAKCVTQIAMSGPKREGWLPFPAKGADVVPHQPFFSRQRPHFCRSGFERQPATRTAVETSVSRSWMHAVHSSSVPPSLPDLSRKVTAHRLPFLVPKGNCNIYLRV